MERKKINLIIIGVGILIMAIVLPISSFIGRKSVTDLNNYGIYSLVASDNEKNGAVINRVEYYVCNGAFDLNKLIELCEKKKNIYKNSTTFAGYYMVVFNDANNVYQSKYPITAMYGGEIDNLRNIYAIYTFGGIGKTLLSELKYYDKNAADSIAKRINIK